MDNFKVNPETEQKLLTNWKKYSTNNFARVTLGIIIGAVAGFMYWKYVGCTSGTCPLTSDPYKSMAWFGLIGGLFLHKKKE